MILIKSPQPHVFFKAPLFLSVSPAFSMWIWIWMKKIMSYFGWWVAKGSQTSEICSILLYFNCSCLLFQDDLIEREKTSYAISGGCCALAAIHLMGKIYVANAGDSRWEPKKKRMMIYPYSSIHSPVSELYSRPASCAPWCSLSTLQHNVTICQHWPTIVWEILYMCSFCRAIIIRNNEVIPMTNEFTPESERQRLQYLVIFSLLCLKWQMQSLYQCAKDSLWPCKCLVKGSLLNQLCTVERQPEGEEEERILYHK